MSLFLREAAAGIGYVDVLARIEAWQSFVPHLGHGIERSGMGPQGHNLLVLLKCLLTGLRVRPDFMLSCGLDLHGPVSQCPSSCGRI